MVEELLIGAVAYDPKVVGIWEGIRSYLREEASLPAEVVLFLSYEAQVRALLESRIDVAWNTNLAYLQCEAWSGGGCYPVAMRDTDRGWTSIVIALKGGQVSSLESLRGRRIALGSRDSGHAAILPVHFLGSEGLKAGRDFEAVRFDTDVGKHGDTGASELEVLRAVLDGRADAGAIGSPFWESARSKGLVPAGAVDVVWSSPPYSHCMFTARAGLPRERARPFAEALYGMDWDRPAHRLVLEAEGLRRWMPPTEDGYDSLRSAAAEQGYLVVPGGPRVAVVGR
jgi:ABC-type phosphate/phosphonate transport system substrate-binding protein